MAACDLLTTSFDGAETLRYEGWTVAAGAGVGVFFVLLGFAIGSVAVAALMLLVPEPVAAGCADGLADQGGSR